MPMPNSVSEKRMAQAARSLAQHLIAYAKDRRDEDKKAISVLHHEICQLHRAEQNGTLQRTEVQE